MMTTMMLPLTALAAILLYLSAAFLLGLRLFRFDRSSPTCRIGALILGLVAASLHGVVLFLHVFTHPGLSLGFFNAFSLIAGMVALLLLLGGLRRPLDLLGILLFPVASLSITLQMAFPSQTRVLVAVNWYLEVHILVSLLAYSVLSIATVQAILLAVQDRQLHTRKPGGLIRSLPPMQIMDTLTFQTTAVGFTLLSLSLLTGFPYLKDMLGQHLAHKTFFSVLAWGIFGTLLWGRWRFGWRGRKALRWMLGGILLLMLAYFGSKLVLELVLA